MYYKRIKTKQKKESKISFLSITGLFIICLLFTSVKDIYAQGMLDSIYNIDEIVVTANRYKVIIPAQKLEGKELKSLNSFSVADAIRYFSGVQIKDYGGIGGIKTVNIRSMGTNHMGVFYDGIQLGNAQNGQIDLGKFSLENIESISLYNGQKSEIFQSAKDFGSSGSIYINTRKPKFKNGKSTNLRAGIKTGSFDLLNPSILYEYKINDKINTSFNAEWINASGKYDFRYKRKNVLGEIAYDTTATRENGDINATRMEAGINGILNKGNWNVRLYNYNSERGIPGAIVNNVWRRGERLWDLNSFIQGTLKKEITDKYKVLVNTKYASDYTHYINNDDKLIKIDNTYKQKELYLSTSNLYAILKHWSVSFSYDFQWNKLDADLQDFPYPTRYTHLASIATAIQLKSFKIQASLLGNFIREDVEKYDKASDKKVYSPAVFISYKPFHDYGLSLRAFYKKAFRMPTFNDLYYTDMGNANLNPEYATQYNLGFVFDQKINKGFFKKINITSDIYYNEVNDKIVAYPKGQQFRWTMINLGAVEIRGVDVSLSNTFGIIEDLFITTKTQYTYQEAQDFTDPSDPYYSDQIPYIPWHSGSLITYINYKKWQFNYSFIYVGERYNQQENIRYNYTQPWYTSDISLTKSVKYKNTDIKISAEVNNLLSQDYDVILNYPMPKRNYKLSLYIEL
ncbi:MAG: TonB-dependent receptor [Bacteroidetes bacterium]|nr:TonB-dependent receptor [Bacteroidota bacterium]